MTFSTGIFLTLVRLYEPLFRVIILQNIYQFFGKVYVHKSKEFENIEQLKAQDQALNTILTSSLNVELVYVVLKGIVMFYKDETLEIEDSTDIVSAPMNNEEKVPLIDMNAADYKFEIDVANECARKRIRTL